MSLILNDVAKFVTSKIDILEIDETNYVSTENMLPNKCGVSEASSLPNTQTVREYLPNDILINNIRPYFKKIWFSNKCGGCSNDVFVLRTKKNYDSKFLYYVLSSDDFFSYVMATAKGTKMPRGDKKAIQKYNVPEFPIEDQIKISSFLNIIDQKIEINKELNKNLEELMHILFKKYFIDENPFYVENNEKWKIIKLKELVIRNREKIKSFDEWKDELLVDLSNMPRFSIAISNFDKGEKFTSNIFRLNKYDLLFGSIRPYFGKVGFSPIDGVVTGTVHSFKPINDIYYSLVLSLISSKTFINYTVSVSKGTKMPAVKWDDFIDYEFAIPEDLSKIKEYNNLLLPIIHKIENNILEIQRLTKLRDTLLPKLMSGEIDVSGINCDLKIIIRKFILNPLKYFIEVFK